MKVAETLSRQWTIVSFLSLLCIAVITEPAQCASSSSQAPSPPNQAQSSIAHLPLVFEQNVGQSDARVRFLARSGRYRVYLTDNAAVLKVAGQKNDAAVRTTIQGIRPEAIISGLEQQAAKTNYLVGPQSAWKTNVPNYAAIKYKSAYPGIDLKYYGKQQQLEYDFDVAPEADPSAIALKIEGADKITTDKDGALVLETAAGEVRWQRPIAYQQTGTTRKLVNAKYQVRGNLVSFDLGRYDRSKRLVIDPVLVYGTYLDGTDFDSGTNLLIDSAGFVYVLGNTSSTDFPTTPGAYQRQIPTSGNGQVFVSKLNHDGSALVWSTIIGGTGSNNFSAASGFALDQSGDVYVVGSTVDLAYINQITTYYPSTFSTTSGAYNTNHAATYREFLVKLNNTGSSLDYSTFLSDQPNIVGNAVAVDVQDNAYVTGIYNQNNGLTAPFPATPGAYQSAYAGHDDAFIMKFNPQASGLVYATLVGGSQSDDSNQIQVDSGGNATIDGPTYSTNYPITPSGKRQTDEGGFITTLNSSGTGLIYSTVLNHVLSINVKRDSAGDYYAGGSAGTNLPTTPNAFQKTFTATGSGIHLGFLTEIDSSGNLVYSSYLAGNPPATWSEDTQVQVVSPGNVTVAGNRYNDSVFPVTDRTYEQDNCSFLAKFNTKAASGKSSLLYSGCTPVNMTNNLVYEGFHAIPNFDGAKMHLDVNNNLYALGTAGPTSPNAFQKTVDPNSGLGLHVWIGKYNLTKAGPGGVNLSAPYYWGPPYQSPVVYRATGRSPQCTAGVAAMRVYISPGVAAYTTAGPTLDANIYFPDKGQANTLYNTVIVVYDNCGHAFSQKVPIYVQGSSPAQNPTVVSPTNGGVVTSPVHFVASANAPSCSKGVAAMRIYTAPGVAAYTVNSSSLDTYIKLAAGSYNTVVQAWDNCGGVYKTPVSITVE